MTDLTKMVNIGKEMAEKLKSVEIDCAERLVEIGSKEAFFRLKTKYPQVCLVHLYALEGAIKNVEYNRLSEETKAELKKFERGMKSVSGNVIRK
ncbi:MAG: TfoX/Sxy family protein [Clostridiales bacterium]|nr:TfoX/Sxy family protein [Clostridiales bacterium]